MRHRATRLGLLLALLVGALLVSGSQARSPAAPSPTGTGGTDLGQWLRNGKLSSTRLAPVRAAQAAPGLSTVADLAARALSSRQMELTFSAPGAPPANDQPAKRYVIKQARTPITATNFDRARSLCGGTCSFSVARTGDRVRLTIEDLTPDRLFHYALRPLDGAGGPGVLSNVVSARTLKDRTRPGRPAGLSARSLRGRRVRLRFRASASDGRSGPPVRRYVVKQSSRPITSARRFRRARSLCRGSCRFGPRRRGARLRVLVGGLCPGRRYYYAVRAKDEGGNLGRVARFRSVRARGSGGLACL